MMELKKSPSENAFKASLKITLPVLAGYVFLGFAFGLLMRTKGFPLWVPVIMSISIYSGALEFAAVLALFGNKYFVLISMVVILAVLIAGKRVIGHE